MRTGFQALGLGLAALAAQACALLAVPALAGAAPVAPATSASPAAPYVIVYKDSVSSPGNETAALHKAAGVNPGLTYASAFKGFAASLTGSQLTAVQSDPNVAYVEPDVTFTSDSGVFLTADQSTGGGVPEPAGWAMMLVGFGGLGACLRRGRPGGPHASTRPKPRPAAEVQAVLAGATPLPEKLRPLRVVLVAGKKDHGKGEHDYPAWQKAWASLFGGAAKVEVATGWEWPG